MSDPIDTGSSEGSHESKDVNNKNGRTEAESNRTENDVDEGVDLQGKVHNLVFSNFVYLESQRTYFITFSKGQFTHAFFVQILQHLTLQFLS